MSAWVVWRWPGLSLRLDRRVPRALLVLALVAGGVIVINTGIGEYPIPPGDVLRAVLGQADPRQEFVVNTLRLPRSLVAWLVGAGLGVAGTILQGLLRNPLAAPDVIGATGGANLAAVAVILFLPWAPLWIVSVSAFAGALVATALTHTLGAGRSPSTERLILVGIGVAALAQAAVSLMLATGQIYYVSQAMIWLTGSVYARSWEHLWPLLGWLGVLVPLAALLARDLDAVALSEDVARGLGSPLERRRALLLLTAAGLAGAAVASAGAVGFVGLLAPHMARRLVGPSHLGLMLTAGAIGGLVVVAADTLGRMLLAPAEIPCGVITAAVGAPYFIHLLYRARSWRGLDQ